MRCDAVSEVAYKSVGYRTRTADNDVALAIALSLPLSICVD